MSLLATNEEKTLDDLRCVSCQRLFEDDDDEKHQPHQTRIYVDLVNNQKIYRVEHVHTFGCVEELQNRHFEYAARFICPTKLHEGQIPNRTVPGMVEFLRRLPPESNVRWIPGSLVNVSYRVFIPLKPLLSFPNEWFSFKMVQSLVMGWMLTTFDLSIADSTKKTFTYDFNEGLQLRFKTILHETGQVCYWRTFFDVLPAKGKARKKMLLMVAPSDEVIKTLYRQIHALEDVQLQDLADPESELYKCIETHRISVRGGLRKVELFSTDPPLKLKNTIVTATCSPVRFLTSIIKTTNQMMLDHNFQVSTAETDFVAWDDEETVMARGSTLAGVPLIYANNTAETELKAAGLSLTKLYILNDLTV